MTAQSPQETVERALAAAKGDGCIVLADETSTANLRWAGLLTGGRPEQDTVWDTLFGGRQFHIRDYY